MALGKEADHAGIRGYLPAVVQSLMKPTIGGQQLENQKRSRQQASDSNESDVLETEHAESKRSKFRAITQERSASY